jgi:hypothetical protein
VQSHPFAPPSRRHWLLTAEDNFYTLYNNNIFSLQIVVEHKTMCRPLLVQLSEFQDGNTMSIDSDCRCNTHTSLFAGMANHGFWLNASQTSTSYLRHELENNRMSSASSRLSVHVTARTSQHSFARARAHVQREFCAPNDDSDNECGRMFHRTLRPHAVNKRTRLMSPVGSRRPPRRRKSQSTRGVQKRNSTAHSALSSQVNSVQADHVPTLKRTRETAKQISFQRQE